METDQNIEDAYVVVANGVVAAQEDFVISDEHSEPVGARDAADELEEQGETFKPLKMI